MNFGNKIGFFVRKYAKGLISAGAAFLLAVCSLVLGNSGDSCRQEVSVSFHVEASRPFICQIFYSENASKPHERNMLIPLCAGTRNIKAVLPIGDCLRALRIDFGSFPGSVKVGPVHVVGRQAHVLEWRDFQAVKDIDEFNPAEDGSVTVVSSKGDPYARYAHPLEIVASSRAWSVNFAVVCLLLVSALIWWLLVGPSGICWDGRCGLTDRVFDGRFAMLALIAVGTRIALSARFPPFLVLSSWDDGWYVNAAAALARGDWLGAYDHHTLTKGCFGPMVLAFAQLSGISYMLLTTALYVLSCFFLLFVISRLVRNRFFLFVILVVLLFNPLSYAAFTWQRVYRNGMALWQVPLVFGSLFMMCRSRKNFRSLIKWAVFSGLSLWMLFNTREDGIWAWPFTLACIAYSGFGAASEVGAIRAKLARALGAMLPLFIVAGGNLMLCAINRACYGVALRNDRDAGNYAKAMRDLYLIKPDPEDESRLSSPEHFQHYHNIYYSTLQKAYAASPTLNGASEQIDAAIDSWAEYGGYGGRDLRLDHVLFAIRNGVYRAGFYGALQDSEKFFGDVHQELTDAFAKGLIESRGFSVTAMAAPFRFEFVPDILREWWNAIAQAAAFKEATPKLRECDLQNATFRLFEQTTGDLYPDSKQIPSVRPYVERAAALAEAYSSAVPYAVVFALFFYVWIFVLLVRRSDHAAETFDWWLFATGVLVSFGLNTACIAYIAATTFGAINCHYLCPSYQLVLIFVVVVAGMVAKVVQNRRRGVARGE